MTKGEIIEKLKPKCNGYDLPLSLNIALVAEILTGSSISLSEALKSLDPYDRDEEGNLISCCGDILDNDIMICPTCKEHN